MAKTRISTKGQVVIPKDVRKRKGWKVGSELEVEELGNAVVLRRPRKYPVTRIDDLVGCVPYDGKARTLDEMEQAIAKGARKRA